MMTVRPVTDPSPLPSSGQIAINPAPSGLPIFGTTQDMVNGIALLALFVCGVALIVGACRWAWGHHTHNAYQSQSGRNQVLGAVGGAFLIGASAGLINFFVSLGRGLH